jgi:hypothetical protein
MGIIQDYVGFEESPDFEIKVNTIIDFWSNPCNAPWTVYVETLYPALGRMLLVIVDVSLLDLIKTYLEPRGQSTRGNKRKKGRRRAIPRGIPDPSDLLARLIPGRDFFEGRRAGPNEAFIWRIDGIIDRGLWYWLIIDATTEGFYWWAMGIKEERFCQPTNRPGMLATSSNPFAIALAGNWIAAGNFTKQWGEPDIDIFISALNVPAGNYTVSYIATYANPHNAYAQFSVRLRGAGPDAVYTVIIPPAQTRTVSFSFPLRGPTVLPFESNTSGVLWLHGSDAVIIVQ